MYYTFFEPFPILDRNQDCCDNTVIIKKEHSKKLIPYLSAFLRQNMHKAFLFSTRAMTTLG